MPNTTFQLSLVLLLTLGFTGPSIVQADAPTVSAAGEYRMAEFDTLAEAQDMALLYAKWQVYDQAAASLEKLPEVKQARFNREELRAYLPGLLEVVGRPLESVVSGTAKVVAVQATAAIDPAVLLPKLQQLLHDEHAKAGLMQSREKMERYRKELEADTQRLTAGIDKSELPTLHEHRRETLILIQAEEELARSVAQLARSNETERIVSPPKGDIHRRPAAANGGGPANAEEHRQHGVHLTEQGQYDAAIREFQAALQLMPTLTRARLGLGAALAGKGELDGAITEYRKVLNLHPDDADAHNNLGTALQRKGDVDGAIAEYQTALQGHPDDPLVHFNLATALSQQDRTDQALKEYRTAIDLRPDFAEAYFNLGRLFQRTNQPREAAEAFRTFLKLAPDTPVNRKWIEEARKILSKASPHRRQR